MQSKDLPEQTLMTGITWVNKYMHNNPQLDVHIVPHLDQAFRAGATDSKKAVSLYQTLIGLKMAVFAKLGDNMDADILQVLTLTDEVLFENKPEIL